VFETTPHGPRFEIELRPLLAKLKAERPRRQLAAEAEGHGVTRRQRSLASEILPCAHPPERFGLLLLPREIPSGFACVGPTGSDLGKLNPSVVPILADGSP